MAFPVSLYALGRPRAAGSGDRESEKLRETSANDKAVKGHLPRPDPGTGSRFSRVNRGSRPREGQGSLTKDGETRKGRKKEKRGLEAAEGVEGSVKHEKKEGTGEKSMVGTRLGNRQESRVIVWR